MDKPICTIDDCHRPARSGVNAFCETHYYRIRRNGDPSVVRTTAKAVVLYRAAHVRVSVARGAARLHSCVDCTTAAEHWSYTHDDPDELVSETGQPYSLDTMRYEPRCAPCHARFDGTGANQYTSR